jgi:AraC-like DNA-binding protein
VQTLYLAANISGALPERCCAINVSPLLRELILYIVRIGAIDKSIATRARLVGFLLDQLSEMPTIPLQLPLPSDERAKKAAAWMRAHPDDGGSLRQIARKASASVRTLERLFQGETGMTIGRWRQQLRLLHALRFLAAGRPVTEVALEVGYDSTSAFIAAFKQVFGTTPARYFD